MDSAGFNADDLKAEVAAAIKQTRQVRRKRFWGVQAYRLKNPVVPFTGARLKVAHEEKWGDHILTLALVRRQFVGGHELAMIGGHKTCVKCGGVRGDEQKRLSRCGDNTTKALVLDRDGSSRLANVRVL
jgi:hypothetical protein